jgi:hypothetical protein
MTRSEANYSDQEIWASSYSVEEREEKGKVEVEVVNLFDHSYQK